jgi:hypothetical protein
MTSFFGSLFGQNHRPYADEAANGIYELLFGDNLSLYKGRGRDNTRYPWITLFSNNSSDAQLITIANDAELPTRVQLLAFNELRKRKVSAEKSILLGVVIEVGLTNGLDVLAAYGDKTVRYINHSGKMIVSESTESSWASQVDDLLVKGRELMKHIGPWNKKRLSSPPIGNLRITLLASDGLYFGEGSIDDMSKDSLGGPVFRSATNLMQALIENGVNMKP